jgi:hypothetical protein
MVLARVRPGQLVKQSTQDELILKLVLTFA